MEISRFEQRFEFSCQTLFAFTFIMGRRAIKTASDRDELSPHGRGECRGMKCRQRSSHLLRPAKFWHADNYVGLRCYTRIRQTTGVQHAIPHASEQTLPVNIDGMASTRTRTTITGMSDVSRLMLCVAREAKILLGSQNYPFN